MIQVMPAPAGRTVLSCGRFGHGIVVLFILVFFPISAIAQVPSIENWTPSNITATSADPNGYMSSTGTAPTEVYVFWGTNDYGAGKSLWANTNYYGYREIGLLITNVTGLIPSTLYYYRYYATNINGDAWAPSSTNFVTGGGGPAVIYVNYFATGADNGTTWADAFTNLQDALSAAVSNDQIWVRAWTYVPTYGTNRSISFEPKNGVSLFGGFAGTETNLQQRNWIINRTVLSGDLNGDDIGFTNNTENSYQVVRGTNNTVLDGFIIERGNADTVSSNQRGGGMLNTGFDNSPKVENCIFMLNSAVEGGAVCNEFYCSPTFSHCTFVNNRATGMSSGQGGGMYNHIATPIITNCVFAGNTVHDWGGAIDIYQGHPEIINCVIVGNMAPTSGGGLRIQQGQATVRNSTIANNECTANGPGICNDISSDLLLENSIVWGNTGAPQQIDNNSATCTVSWCDIEGGITNIINGTLLTNGVNLQQHPKFVGGTNGTWSGGDATFNATNLQTTLYDPSAGWFENELAGKFVQPNSAEPYQYLIASNAPTMIFARGDVTAFGTVSNGFPYQIHDYHLESTDGHWESGFGTWSNDVASSPSIDAGNPASSWANEPSPNGGRINIGAYGNTPEASKSAPGTPPIVDNDGGPVNITENSAKLRGSLSSTGGLPTAAWVFWGTNDFGTSTSAWPNAIYVGLRGTGIFETNIFGLVPSDLYYYRCYATNSAGEAWAPTTTNFFTPPGGLNWNDWSHRMKIRFSGYDKSQTLTNFPALVVLSQAIPGFDYAHFESTIGGDLRFANSNETVQLSYEVEKWDNIGSSFVWVQVPELRNSNTYIWAYWGNPILTNPPPYTTDGSTWSEDFGAVWHMQQPNVPDSTFNANSGTSYGNTTVAGPAGNAQDFNGSSAYAQVSDQNSLTPTSGITVSCFIRPDTLGTGTQNIISKRNGSNVGGYVFEALSSTSVQHSVYANLTWKNAAYGYDNGSWQHIAMTHDGVNIRVYKNGIPRATTSQAATLNDDDGILRFGANSATLNNFFDGALDEVRISSTARSMEWIQASAESVLSNSMFNAYGPVEVVGMPEMLEVTGGGQPDGPAYTFFMSKYEIRNSDYVEFLNDAKQNQFNERGTNMYFDGGGNVFMDSGMLNSEKLFSITNMTTGPQNGITYDTTNLVYEVIPGMEDHPVVGASWFGAVKYCNWLTIKSGRGPAERCYAEGTFANAWKPVPASNWPSFTEPERLDWVQNYDGFRLPMDEYYGYATNYNEFYKAAAWNGVSNKLFGFGRDAATAQDANYGGELWPSNTTPVGHYDGTNVNYGGTTTVDSANMFGLYDLSGNLVEWSSDTHVTNDAFSRAARGGHWNSSAANLQNHIRMSFNPELTDYTVGFRVVSTFDVGETTGPPQVMNEPASGITDVAATLNGNLVSTGGAPTEVYILWGVSDMGMSFGFWEHTNNLGILPPGPFGYGITNLIPETPYYYVCYATNAYGGAWAPGTTNFMTFADPGDGGLNYRTYDTLYGTNYLHPISNLFAQSHSGTGVQIGPLSYNAGSFTNLSGITSVGMFSVLWDGVFVSTGGVYTFGTRSDDGSVLYLDLNKDGDFSDVGELIVDNNGDHGGVEKTNTVLLGADEYPIAIGYYDNLAGTEMEARWGRGDGWPSYTSLAAIDSTSGVFKIGYSFTINNDGGATAITTDSATLNGNLMSTGGAPTEVYIMWGTNDEGTVLGWWENTSYFGYVEVGSFFTNIFGLSSNTTYYYRCYATNAYGDAWAPQTTNFVTMPAGAPSVELLKPQNYAELVSFSWTDPTNAFDALGVPGDESSQTAYLLSTSATDNLYFNQWTPPIRVHTQLTLSVKWKTDGNFTDDSFYFDYTTNGGLGWNVLLSSGTYTDMAWQVASTPLAPNTDHGLLQVRVGTAITTGQDGGMIYISDVYTEGMYDPYALAIVNQSPSGITDNDAVLNGYLASTGTAPTEAWVYWGAIDGGTNAGNWEHTNYFGYVNEGAIFTNITGLTPGTNYFYRYYATNDAAQTRWAPNSEMFVTTGGGGAEYFKIYGIPSPLFTNQVISEIYVEAHKGTNIWSNYTGTVEFSSPNPGSFPIDYTFQLADNGVHVFSNEAWFTQAGDDVVLSVSDTNNPSMRGDQFGIVVLNGYGAQFDRLIMTTIAEPLNTGQWVTVAIGAVDQHWNLATNYVGTVDFSSSDGSASLPLGGGASYTFSPGNYGWRAFSNDLQFNTVGEHWLRAQDSVNSNVFAQLWNITVQETIVDTNLDHFVIEIPHNVITGEWHGVTFEARSISEHTVDWFNGTLNVTSSDPLAIYPATVLFSGGDNGMKFMPNSAQFWTVGTQSMSCWWQLDTNKTGLADNIQVTDGVGDGDGDGMPDAWEIQHFGDTNAVPTDDSDADGLDNVGEYIADTIPTNAQSVLKIVDATIFGGDPRIYWLSSSNRNYDILVSTNMVDWGAAVVDEPGTAPTNFYTHSPVPADSIYYRVLTDDGISTSQAVSVNIAAFHWLNLVTNGNGSVDVPPGWIPEVTNLVMLATPSNNYHFVDWTGDIASTNNPLTLGMTQAWNIVVNFELDQHELVVGSGYGSPYPALGTNLFYYGTTVTCEVNSPIPYGAETQYVCVGWTGSGSVPISGSTTNTGPITITNNSGILWNWMTNYDLAVAVAGSGSVDVPPGWYDDGTNLLLNATPSNGYHFATWSGDVVTTNNPLNLTMTRSYNLTANFAINTNSLDVLSQQGLPNPAVGTTWYTEGTLVDASVDSPVVIGAETQYVCLGWSGTGDVPVSGGGTNTSFVISNNSAITWLWQTNYWLDSTAGPNGSVDVPSGWYETGSNFTIYATASNGYSFLAWSGDTNGCTIIGPQLIVTMDQPRSVTADFELTLYDIDAAAGLNGIMSPTGTVWVGHGSNQLFTITPDPNYHVLDVLVNVGSIGPTNDYTFVNVTNGGQSIDVTFEIDKFTLDVTSPYGTPIPAGLTTNDWNTLIDASVDGSPVVVGAATQYVCYGWTGTGVVVPGTGTNTSFSITSNSALEWLWATNYWLDATADPNGSVDASTNWYESGSNVVVTATPSNGYSFLAWSGDTNGCVIAANQITAVMDQSRAITANFGMNIYTISVQTVFNGSITPSGNVPVGYGSNQLFTITPNVNYNVQDVLVDAVSIGPTNSYTFMNVASNHSIDALFALNTYTFTASSLYGSPAPAGVTTNAHGLPINASIAGSPALIGSETQYVCVGWTGSGSVSPTGSATNTSFSITNTSTITWNWITNYDLTLTVGGNGAVDVPSGWYDEGTNLLLTATPSNGYHFLTWSGDIVTTNNPLNLTMTRSYNLTAGFEINTNSLDVLSQQGLPTPSVGTTWFNEGTLVDASVDSPVQVGGETQYVCLGWSGAGDVPVSGAATNTSFVISNDSAIAWLWQTNYSLDLTPGIYGSLSHTSEWYAADSNIAVTALPDPNYHFLGWTGDIVSTNNPLNIPMDKPYTLTADFEIDTYTLTVSSTAGGSATTPGEGIFTNDFGATPTIIAVSNANYHFLYWSGTAADAGKVADTNAESTTVTTDGDYTLVANFAIDTYLLTVSSTAGGSATTPGEGVFTNDYGATPAISAVSNANYHFLYWSGTAADAGKVADTNAESTTVTTDGDYTLVANFASDTYTLTISSTAGGSAATPGEGVFTNDYGATPAIVATSNANYHFLYWSGTAADAGKVADTNAESTTVTTDGDYTLVANFASDTYTLSVVSLYGAPTPSGVSTSAWNTPFVASVAGSPLLDGTTQHVCVGWTGTGSVPSPGSITNISFNLTVASSLTWNWQTWYRLSTAAGANGTVDVSSAWMFAGTNLTITATADPGYSFVQWTGPGVPPGSATVNPLPVTMNQARDITATFALNLGYVQVMITPASAAAGATWNLTTGPDTGAHVSGDVIPNVPGGTFYTVQFSAAAGWAAPFAITNVWVVNSQTTVVTGIYLPGEMVTIPGGTFDMGIYYGQGGHSVTLSAFQLDTREVTVGEYLAFCTATTRTPPPTNGVPGGWSNQNLPIVNVTWQDANAYAAWAGKRLPTEAEWEFAARSALPDSLYPWGNTDPTVAEANFANNVGNRTIAGSYPANAYGLYDIAGNAGEWCYDWFESPLADGTVNPDGPPSGMYHVLRGGSWLSLSTRLRCAVRSFLQPGVRYNDLGFRCARTVQTGFTAPLGTPFDTDADGLPDWWEKLYYDGGAGGIAVLPTDDTDTDGMNSFQEFIAGTDPTDPKSLLAFNNPQVEPSSTGRIIHWPSIYGRVYSVQRASRLTQTFVTIDSGLQATPPQNEYIDRATGDETYFYRILVEQK
ncbi:MAG: DUF2341 domain-containing protein [Lentisphaerales bacterium]|nr:MAG: DUF2341 domain-containing protein [Lentisphaerales bacterium]